jgi:hypothetical protein
MVVTVKTGKEKIKTMNNFYIWWIGYKDRRIIDRSDVICLREDLSYYIYAEYVNTHWISYNAERAENPTIVPKLFISETIANSETAKINPSIAFKIPEIKEVGIVILAEHLPQILNLPGFISDSEGNKVERALMIA